MKIIHISDLHLGQILYQHYDRNDEHDHFFSQLEKWCKEENPDVLLITGDIFDIQQPSAVAWQRFTAYFVSLRHACRNMRIIMIAGNHDSPSRLHSHKLVWEEIGITICALPPSAASLEQDLESVNEYIIELPSGYVVGLPYMPSFREETVQRLLDIVTERNREGIPVIMTGHLTVGGCDITGHDFNIGNLRTISLERLGSGYDYLALGHIHRAQTIGEEPDRYDDETVVYNAPVARYAGSVLHVSIDEMYPHSASIIQIDKHSGSVKIRTRRIEQLRHFHNFPTDSKMRRSDAADILKNLESEALAGTEGYFRFKLDVNVKLPVDFNQKVYEIIEKRGGKLRYNPKIEWIGEERHGSENEAAPRFEVAELQQMTDPYQFIEKTIERYPDIDLDDLGDIFREINEELRRMDEAVGTKRGRK